MKAKQATLKRPEGELVFFFPIPFTDEAIITAIKAIRTGDNRNWERKFLGLDAVITIVEEVKLTCEYKYIVTHEEKHSHDKYMVVFPKEIDHDRMFEMIQHAVYDSVFPDDAMPISIFSAGFINTEGTCFGYSETLDVKSDKEDMSLFMKTFN